MRRGIMTRVSAPPWRRVTPDEVVTSTSDAYFVLASLGAPVGLALFFLGAFAGAPVVLFAGLAIGMAGILLSWVVILRVSRRIAPDPLGPIPRWMLHSQLGSVAQRPSVVRRAVVVLRRS